MCRRPPKDVIYNLAPVEYYGLESCNTNKYKIYRSVDAIINDKISNKIDCFYWSVNLFNRYNKKRMRDLEGFHLVAEIKKIIEEDSRNGLIRPSNNFMQSPVFLLGDDPDRTLGLSCFDYKSISFHFLQHIYSLLKKDWPLWRVIIDLVQWNDTQYSIIVYPDGFYEQRRDLDCYDFKNIKKTECDVSLKNSKLAYQWYSSWYSGVEESYNKNMQMLEMQFSKTLGLVCSSLSKVTLNRAVIVSKYTRVSELNDNNCIWVLADTEINLDSIFSSDTTAKVAPINTVPDIYFDINGNFLAEYTQNSRFYLRAFSTTFLHNVDYFVRTFDGKPIKIIWH